MKTLTQKNDDVGRAFGNRTSTVPTKYYVGLSKADVVVIDNVNQVKYINESLYSEVTASDYQRTELDNVSTSFSVPSNGSVTNLNAIVFDEAISNWGNVYAIGVYDAPTGGNLRYISALEAPRLVEIGTSLILKAGAFEIAEVDYVTKI